MHDMKHSISLFFSLQKCVLYDKQTVSMHTYFVVFKQHLIPWSYLSIRDWDYRKVYFSRGLSGGFWDLENQADGGKHILEGKGAGITLVRVERATTCL